MILFQPSAIIYKKSNALATQLLGTNESIDGSNGIASWPVHSEGELHQHLIPEADT
jgi:hypothetical protein